MPEQLDHFGQPLLATTLIALFKGFALSRQNREMPVSSAKAVRILLGLPH